MESGGLERDGLWVVLPHARQRMEEMGVGAGEVLAVLDNPLVTYPCGPAHPGRRLLKSGRLVVCTDREVVVTVLWNTTEPFERRTNGTTPSALDVRTWCRAGSLDDLEEGIHVTS